MNLRQLCFCVAAVASANVTWAQQAYYDPESGVMCLDTGITDLVAVFIEGPDVSELGCELCDGMNLPGEDALGNSSTWTVGFINGSTQWIRTNPLQGRGFVGAIGEYFVDGNGVEQAWPEDFPPFLDFPAAFAGIANYGPGLSSSDFGLATYAADDGSVVTSSVTVAHCDDGTPAPIAQDDFYEVMPGGLLEVAAPGVLANDFDLLGRPLYAKNAYAYGDPSHGTLTSFDDDGAFTYQASGDVPVGTVDRFSYYAMVDYGNFAKANVYITFAVPEPSCGMCLGPLMILWLSRSGSRVRRGLRFML
ncbi:MAG: hypothetical protein AAGF97_19245 [Planctomycetota bacterium]